MEGLVELLRCPVTGQALATVSPELLAALLEELAAGRVRTRTGARPEPFGSALVTADGSRIYPVRDDIPILLEDAAMERPAAAGT